MKELHSSDLYTLQKTMKGLYDSFNASLEKVDTYKKMTHKNLEKNEIKCFYNYSEDFSVELMAQFDLEWTMEEVIALFFEADLYDNWLQAPDGKPLKTNLKNCETQYSLELRLPFPWPIWPRFGSLKMMVYLEPECNGTMIVNTSHNEEQKEFFGVPLPENPKHYVRIDIRK